MARAPRVEVPGGIWHLVARGVRRQPLFRDHHDYERFLALLDEVARRHGWVVHAYCLMPNHYHLLVVTPQPTLSDGMERLNGRYAQLFNDRHDLEGHVFERRFRSIRIRGEGHLLLLARYIALNPVRARLCSDPMLWRWSSYAATLGRTRRPAFLTIDWLLRLFGDDRRAARAAYERYVLGTLVEHAPAAAST